MENPHYLGAQGNKRRGKSVSRSEDMKAEYDFSKAERGKFYHPDADFRFPVYLDPDVNDFLSKLAQQKQVDIQDLVNDWLRVNINFVQGAE